MSEKERSLTKKGVSPVIASVVLILFTIAAVAIIFGIVVPFVSDAPAEATKCIDYRTYFSFEEVVEISGQDNRFNCFTSDLSGNREYGLTLRAENLQEDSANVIGFALVFETSDGVIKTLNVDNEGQVGDGSLRMASTGSTDIVIPEAGGRKTYIYTPDILDIEFRSVRVAPKLAGDGDLCDESDEILYKQCSFSDFADVG